MDFPPELLAALGKSSPIVLIALWAGMNIREMTKSVVQLNEKIALLLERTEGHGKRLDEHADRLGRLEIS